MTKLTLQEIERFFMLRWTFEKTTLAQATNTDTTKRRRFSNSIRWALSLTFFNLLVSFPWHTWKKRRENKNENFNIKLSNAFSDTISERRLWRHGKSYSPTFSQNMEHTKWNEKERRKTARRCLSTVVPLSSHRSSIAVRRPPPFVLPCRRP